MAFSKVILNGTTLMDVTDTTATTADVIAPKNFYGADGKKKTGVNIGGGGAIVLQDTDGSIILDDGTQNAALLQHKEVKQIDGVQTITPDTGFVGLSSVTVGFDKDADFCFWDYDGTPLYSFSFAEIAEMTELPEPPDHSQDEVPLTFQYWNWDLADLKELDYPMDIGAVYYPTDGKIHWYYELNEVSGLTCSFTTTQTKSITIDWGDGTVEQWGSNEALGANPTHTYAQPGLYHCTWDGDGQPSSQMRIEGNGSLVGTFYVGGAGNNTDWLNNYWQNTFAGSYIDYIVGFTRVLPNSGFNSMYNLKAFVTGKNYGSWTGGSHFSYCPNLKVLCLSKASNIRLADYYGANSSLPRLRIYRDFQTNINRFLFQSCNSLEFYNLPATYRSVQNCYNLRRIVIIGDISTETFQNCPIQEIWCGLNTPPTLTGTNSFNKISKNCKIHVKASALSDFQTATNWATFADYMVGDWDGDPDR